MVYSGAGGVEVAVSTDYSRNADAPNNSGPPLHLVFIVGIENGVNKTDSSGVALGLGQSKGWK